MRKRITFEEAARLKNTIQTPPRLPYHADVNGNPVYQQFMRLTHIYEEDELVKRQDETQALAARLAMVRGLGGGPRVYPMTQSSSSMHTPPGTPLRLGRPGGIFNMLGAPIAAPGGAPGGEARGQHYKVCSD